MDSYDRAQGNLANLSSLHDVNSAESHNKLSKAHRSLADEAAQLARNGKPAFWNVTKTHNAKADYHAEEAKRLKKDPQMSFFAGVGDCPICQNRVDNTLIHSKAHAEDCPNSEAMPREGV